MPHEHWATETSPANEAFTALVAEVEGAGFYEVAPLLLFLGGDGAELADAALREGGGGRGTEEESGFEIGVEFEPGVFREEDLIAKFSFICHKSTEFRKTTSRCLAHIARRFTF